MYCLPEQTYYLKQLNLSVKIESTGFCHPNLIPNGLNVLSSFNEGNDSSLSRVIDSYMSILS
ncbi:MAG: hypothetical protein ACJAUY_000608 [Cognaticolwellia sp.]